MISDRLKGLTGDAFHMILNAMTLSPLVILYRSIITLNYDFSNDIHQTILNKINTPDFNISRILNVYYEDKNKFMLINGDTHTLIKFSINLNNSDKSKTKYYCYCDRRFGLYTDYHYTKNTFIINNYVANIVVKNIYNENSFYERHIYIKFQDETINIDNDDINISINSGDSFNELSCVMIIKKSMNLLNNDD